MPHHLAGATIQVVNYSHSVNYILKDGNKHRGSMCSNDLQIISIKTVIKETNTKITTTVHIKIIIHSNVGFTPRKPVFRVCDQLRQNKTSMLSCFP